MTNIELYNNKMRCVKKPLVSNKPSFSQIFKTEIRSKTT